MLTTIDDTAARNDFFKRVAARLVERAGGGPVEVRSEVVEWKARA